MRELKIGASGVRGVVGDALTPELVIDFASALGTWAEGGPVALARDTRRSSPMLHAAAVAGLAACGCEIIDLGVGSTPLLSFAVRELGCAAGICITGSHNDARWNALKFLGPDGLLLDAVKGEELLDIYHAAAFRTGGPPAPARTFDRRALVERYIANLSACLDVEAVRAAAWKVAVDFCNGTCAETAMPLLAELGCTVMPLHAQADGSFARPPEPVPAHMGAPARFTAETGADIGAALNVDGDRIAFILPGGTPLSEECTLPLAALGRLARRPGTIVTNLSTSRMIEVVAGRAGCSVLRTPVGESNVMGRGLEEDAVLAGEGSGGVAALPASMTFDALLALGMVLEAMSAAGGLPELAAQLPRLEMRKGKVPCPPAQACAVLEHFRQALSDLAPDVSDGVRVAWDDAWLHVRVSNTEPLVRVIVEAECAGRADELFAEAMAAARRAAGGAEGR